MVRKSHHCISWILFEFHFSLNLVVCMSMDIRSIDLKELESIMYLFFISFWSFNISGLLVSWKCWDWLYLGSRAFIQECKEYSRLRASWNGKSIENWAFTSSYYLMVHSMTESWFVIAWSMFSRSLQCLCALYKYDVLQKPFQCIL